MAVPPPRDGLRNQTLSPVLQRSSHVISVIGRHAFIFGGELVPREPRDNKTVAVDLSDYEISTAKPTPSPFPSARVGTASIVLGSKIYMFSGRGGPSMSPTDEQGNLWCFDPALSIWGQIMPLDSTKTYPFARSYHCMASDGIDKIYLHAGCPASGRLADLWVFSLSQRTWTQLSDAPGPQRGGASIAFAESKLYRMNGFDGKSEQGGSIDVYDPQSNEWSQEAFVADGIEGPEARSVSALLSIVLEGKPMLLTLFGERDPSSLGHAGAGKMLGDIWLYDIAKRIWQNVKTSSRDGPPARGWFAADVFEGSKIIIAGGLSETNERLDDIWTLSL